MTVLLNTVVFSFEMNQLLHRVIPSRYLEFTNVRLHALSGITRQLFCVASFDNRLRLNVVQEYCIDSSTTRMQNKFIVFVILTLASL